MAAPAPVSTGPLDALLPEITQFRTVQLPKTPPPLESLVPWSRIWQFSSVVRAPAEIPPPEPSGGDEEHPLLDFGDASEGPFFPSLKAASVQSAVPFGPRAGRPLRRLKDPDLARAFAAAGWSSQSVSPELLLKSNGFSLHAATRGQSRRPRR